MRTLGGVQHLRPQMLLEGSAWKPQDAAGRRKTP